MNKPLEPVGSQMAVDRLVDYLLGADWYVADPLSLTQVNAIVIEEIKKKYPPADANFFGRLKWWFRVNFFD